MFLNFANWYWSGTPGIYSTASGAMIAEPNAAYDAWKTANTANPWPKDIGGNQTTAAMDAYLAQLGLHPTGLTSPSATTLMAYANGKLAALMATPRTYPLGSGVSVKADATTATGADLLSLNVWGTANAAATQPWVDNFGAVTKITGAEAVTLANAVLAYGQSVYAILASAMTGIAGGAITLTTQVDALAWPT